MTNAYTDLRIPRSLLRVCGLLARQTGTKMSNQHPHENETTIPARWNPFPAKTTANLTAIHS